MSTDVSYDLGRMLPAHGSGIHQAPSGTAAMIGGEKHSYDMGGELPPSPRQRQRQALAVHMIDPFDIAVLCGTPVFQNATNDPQQVTCRACLRVRQRRLRRAGIKPDTETVTVASRIRGVAAPGGEF